MTPLVVVILAVMWLLVLVPPLLRGRTDGRPTASVSSFQRQLSTLQRTGPVRPSARRPAAARPSGSPYAASYAGVRPGSSATPRGGRGPSRASREMARRRRQNVLMVLAASSLLTAVLAFGLGFGAARYAFFGLVVLFGLYVLLLVQLRRNEVAARQRQVSRVAYSRAA